MNIKVTSGFNSNNKIYSQQKRRQKLCGSYYNNHPTFKSNIRYVGDNINGLLIQLKKFQELGKDASSMIKSVLSQVRNPSSKVREEVAKTVARIGSEQDVDDLKPLLMDAESSVRYRALDAIEQIGSPQKHIDIIAPHRLDGNEAVRIKAQKVYNKFNKRIQKSAVEEMLKPAIESHNPEIRMSAIDFIEAEGNKENIPLLKPLAKDSDEKVLNKLMQFLFNEGEAKDIDIIEDLLNHKNGAIKNKARELFNKKSSSESKGNDKFIKELRAKLKEIKTKESKPTTSKINYSSSSTYNSNDDHSLDDALNGFFNTQDQGYNY